MGPRRQRAAGSCPSGLVRCAHLGGNTGGRLLWAGDPGVPSSATRGLKVGTWERRRLALSAGKGGRSAGVPTASRWRPLRRHLCVSFGCERAKGLWDVRPRPAVARAPGASPYCPLPSPQLHSARDTIPPTEKIPSQAPRPQQARGRSPSWQHCLCPHTAIGAAFSIRGKK